MILSIVVLVLIGVLVYLLINNSHYKKYKNIISQDKVEQTLFGQPISKERDGEYRIGVKCSDNGDYHATLTIYQAKNGKYENVFTCPALIGKNGPGKQSEGDVKTPLGTWEIGEAYGIEDDPGSIVKYTKITDDMLKKYEVDSASAGNIISELKFIDEAGAPYAGNAIFLHCWKDENYPTGGCVAVSEESMVTVLKTVTPGTTVTIY